MAIKNVVFLEIGYSCHGSDDMIHVHLHRYIIRSSTMTNTLNRRTAFDVLHFQFQDHQFQIAIRIYINRAQRYKRF